MKLFQFVPRRFNLATVKIFPVVKHLNAKWRFSAIFEIQTRLPPLAAWSGRRERVLCGEQCHQVVQLVGLVLLQPTWGNRQHDGHAACEAQMYGDIAAKKVVVEQRVASYAWVDSFQGVSLGQCLFPYHEPLLVDSIEIHATNSTTLPLRILSSTFFGLLTEVLLTNCFCEII